MFDLAGADGALPDLTDEQRRAVTHDGGSLLIVAGAGTGKTTTLSARLAHLVADGAPPERILLLTFSRRAAAELLRRAEQWAGHDRLRARGAAPSTPSPTGCSAATAGRSASTPTSPCSTRPTPADLLALVRDELVDRRQRRQRRRARKELLAGR